MNRHEKRLQTLETAIGMTDDNSFCAQVARMHARGEKVPLITVEPGEAEEEVREREGIADDLTCIVIEFVRSMP